MIVAACGSLFASACKHTGIGGRQDSGPDSITDQRQDAALTPARDAGRDGDTAPPVDGNRDDLWNVPCE